MAEVRFIKAERIKEKTVISDNVDNDLINPVIVEAQDLQIHPIIGTGIFNELKTQITAGTLTVLNTTLLNDYIQPALVQWVKYYGLPDWLYKISNKTVGVKNSDNSSPASLSDLHKLQDSTKSKAEMYSERITKYLMANSASYPLYDNPGSSCDTIYPDANNYHTGFYLD